MTSSGRAGSVRPVQWHFDRGERHSFSARLFLFENWGIRLLLKSMILLKEAQIDRIVTRSPYYLVGGLSLLVIPLFLRAGWHIEWGGVLTGLALGNLGTLGLVLRKWRTERGIWMLAGFLSLLLGSIWLPLEYESVSKLLDPAKPKRWLEIAWTVDTIVGTVLLARVVRFGASVLVRNWQRTSRVDDP